MQSKQFLAVVKCHNWAVTLAVTADCSHLCKFTDNKSSEKVPTGAELN